MDLENKLKNIPHVYYFNLDNRTDRKEYIESQFDQWGVTNFTRVSGSKYLASAYDDWKHLVKRNEFIPLEQENLAAIGNTITHIEFLNWWLNNTTEEHCVIMEDDVDFSLVEYWHFDWDYLMENIPYDWDCIQLSYASRVEMKFFLSPKPGYGTFSGPSMLNRRYVEKLVSLHYKNNQFILDYKINDNAHVDQSLGVDYIICSAGKTYCLPLLSVNDKLGSYENNVPRQIHNHARCIDLGRRWWRSKRDDFTPKEFFTYNTPRDDKRTIKV